ncbi:hypothetical protein COEREDRAFT_83946 [Coemansia reversa NRRL 1564]|uniref:Protein YTP1-like C-terminal domain-containing protein n=1 Tax=Coemansia reversa (strain ATCC 12441 / NRRL 1564) TaxID=763665 RepID=A0A2G5B143_COERN|nr:hypothetical protein COEREDRAFT_83946 [Coemansia reversa NRRL 1564]|eukprot:PIA12733.1 hypothetical protein COEREDRAFT_83946 [Coemansia reversa NRRL 1564]
MVTLNTPRLWMKNPTVLTVIAPLIASAALASAHEDEVADVNGAHMAMKAEDLPNDAFMYRWPEDPMGWALKVHLLLCAVGYIMLLPTALVMEVARHKLQPLFQISGALVAFLGIVFGWLNGHLHNTYARFGWFMVCLLTAQTSINLYRTLSSAGRSQQIRRVYLTLGTLQMIFMYMGMVLGVIRFLNLCSQGHLGQCISHFVRGSALMIGSVLILICTRVFGAAMLELKRPPEFYLSIVMIIVGTIATFTEHNFFQSSGDAAEIWSHKDLQHTMIGISWFAGGLLGALMTYHSHPRNRSAIPSLVFIATGISMIIHQQDLVMSSRVHFLFGTSLVSLGLSTICEITLLASGFVKDRDKPASFQYVTMLLFCSAGMFLMGANRDMVLFLIYEKIDITTYAVTLLSFCFAIMLYFYLLVDLYFTLAGPPTAKYSQLGEEEQI